MICDSTLSNVGQGFITLTNERICNKSLSKRWKFPIQIEEEYVMEELEEEELEEQEEYESETEHNPSPLHMQLSRAKDTSVFSSSKYVLFFLHYLNGELYFQRMFDQVLYLNLEANYLNL